MRPRCLAGSVVGVLLGLVGVLPVSSPAWAKYSYELTVRERQVRVGDTIHVTATIDDDNYEGQPGSRMCLFQMPGQLPPNQEYSWDELKVTYTYRPVAGCRKVRAVPDTGWQGVAEFRLRATAPGRLTLVAIGEPDGKLDVGEPYEKGQPQVFIGTRLVTVDVVDPHSSTPVTSPAAVVALPGSGGSRPNFSSVRPAAHVPAKPAVAGPGAEPPARSASGAEPPARSASGAEPPVRPASVPASPAAAASSAASGAGPAWILAGVVAAGCVVAAGALAGSRLRRRSRS